MKQIDPESLKYCHNDFSPAKSFIYDHVRIAWDEQITFHQSLDWELSYIIRGSGSRLIGDQMEPFTTGEVILIPPHLPHGWYFDEYDHDEDGKIENITIIFPDSLLDRFANNFNETGQYIRRFKKIKEGICFEGETLNILKQMLLNMLYENDMEQVATFLKIVHLIASSSQSRIVGSMVKETKSNAKIREVYRFMITNYQRNISLNEVAQYIGMNRSSFCSFYKREKGKTFFTDLNQYRVDCSCMMLRETNMPIADICFAVGFNDVPHFNRTFKKIKGRSPNSYRNENGKKNG